MEGNENESTITLCERISLWPALTLKISEYFYARENSYAKEIKEIKEIKNGPIYFRSSFFLTPKISLPDKFMYYRTSHYYTTKR